MPYYEVTIFSPTCSLPALSSWGCCRYLPFSFARFLFSRSVALSETFLETKGCHFMSRVRLAAFFPCDLMRCSSLALTDEQLGFTTGNTFSHQLVCFLCSFPSCAARQLSPGFRTFSPVHTDVGLFEMNLHSWSSAFFFCHSFFPHSVSTSLCFSPP